MAFSPGGPARRVSVKGILAILLVAIGLFALIGLVLRLAPAGARSPDAFRGRAPSTPGGSDANPPGGPGPDGASADPAGPGIPAPAWEDRARARRASLVGEFGPDLAFRERRPFLLAAEPDAERDAQAALDAAAGVLAHLQETLRRDFALRPDARAAEPVLPVVLLATRAAYDRYLERDRRRPMPDSRGHYEFNRRRLVLCRGPRDDTQVLFHEGTHLLVRQGARPSRAGAAPDAFWFHEGLACYYEAFERDAPGTFVLPAVNRHRWSTAAEAMDANVSAPLADLLALSVDGFWTLLEDPALDAEARTRRARTLYAEAWALWHYLLNAPGRRDAVRAYFQAELDGRGGIETFKSCFGDLEGLERELRKHLRSVTTSQEQGVAPTRPGSAPHSRACRLGDLDEERGSDNPADAATGSSRSESSRRMDRRCGSGS